MDGFQAKGITLQESLANLSLLPNKKKGELVTESIVVGKILTSRTFRRLTIAEIIQKAWKLNSNVQVTNLADNIFKFTIKNKKDIDFVL